MTKSQVRFFKDMSGLSVPTSSDTISSDIRRIGEKRRTLSPLSHAICYLFEKLNILFCIIWFQRKWSSFVI